MTPTSKSFKDIHETELTKFDMRAAVLRGTSTVDARRKTACAELDTDDPLGYQAMRTRAAEIKDAVLADLPAYIEMFANNAEAAGAQRQPRRDPARRRRRLQAVHRGSPVDHRQYRRGPRRGARHGRAGAGHEAPRARVAAGGRGGRHARRRARRQRGAPRRPPRDVGPVARPRPGAARHHAGGPRAR